MRDWKQSRELLLQNITLNLHLNPQSNYRFVVQIPNDPIDHFKVSIGASTTIKVSLEMLENIFNATIGNQGIYNKAVIFGLYHREVNNHGCHVHVVGQLFESAAVMINQGHNYHIV